MVYMFCILFICFVLFLYCFFVYYFAIMLFSLNNNHNGYFSVLFIQKAHNPFIENSVNIHKAKHEIK